MEELVAEAAEEEEGHRTGYEGHEGGGADCDACYGACREARADITYVIATTVILVPIGVIWAARLCRYDPLYESPVSFMVILPTSFRCAWPNSNST